MGEVTHFFGAEAEKEGQLGNPELHKAHKFSFGKEAKPMNPSIKPGEYPKLITEKLKLMLDALGPGEAVIHEFFFEKSLNLAQSYPARAPDRQYKKYNETTIEIIRSFGSPFSRELLSVIITNRISDKELWNYINDENIGFDKWLKDKSTSVENLRTQEEMNTFKHLHFAVAVIPNPRRAITELWADKVMYSSDNPKEDRKIYAKLRGGNKSCGINLNQITHNKEVTFAIDYPTGKTGMGENRYGFIITDDDFIIDIMKEPQSGKMRLSIDKNYLKMMERGETPTPEPATTPEQRIEKVKTGLWARIKRLLKL